MTLFRYKFQNKGNAKAILVAAFAIDTTSGGDILRKIILDKKLRREYLLSTERLDRYYKNFELNPTEQDSLEIESYTRFQDNFLFTQHFLLLYTNEAGAYFDTYYWARFSTATPWIKFPKGTQLYITKEGLKDMLLNLPLKDYEESNKIYSKDEIKRILEFIEE